MAGKTCILGDGSCAHRVASHLLAAGETIVIATGAAKSDAISETNFTENDLQHIEILNNTIFKSLHGTCGDFTLKLSSDNQEIIRQVSTIVVAEEGERRSNRSHYGLIASDVVLSPSRLSALLTGDGGGGFLPTDLKHAVFLNGLMEDSHPVITREIMRLCLALQTELKVQTYVLTGNLKVAANGLEVLYRRTKEAGTCYVKFTENQPEMVQAADDGGVRIEFKDEITGQHFRLQPDLIVVDETFHPSDSTKLLAQTLELETDGFGFLQTDNVHRLTGFTNRKGILVTGPVRGLMSLDDQIVDADSVSAAALRINRFSSEIPNDRAAIKTGRCIRCLTCHRLCPYRAIQLNGRVSVMPDACERCGICAAECPRGAITIPGLADHEIREQIENSISSRHQEASSPSIVAFCCSRSAIQAMDLAGFMGLPLPKGLQVVEVPCAGSISVEHLLSAFQGGADGVLLLTCHAGNCHSERGNALAEQRAALLIDLLPHLGFEADRLAVDTLAANMGVEFAEIVNGFEQTIRGLG